jgi:integrase
MEAGMDLPLGAFVFSHRADGASPWLPNWTTKEFVAAQRAAWVDHFRLHDLRHFPATQMLAAGIPCDRIPASQPRAGVNHVERGCALRPWW